MHTYTCIHTHNLKDIYLLAHTRTHMYIGTQQLPKKLENYIHDRETKTHFQTGANSTNRSKFSKIFRSANTFKTWEYIYIFILTLIK